MIKCKRRYMHGKRRRRSPLKTTPRVFTMGPTDGTEKKTTGLTNPFFPKIGGSRKKSKNGKRTK